MTTVRTTRATLLAPLITIAAALWLAAHAFAAAGALGRPTCLFPTTEAHVWLDASGWHCQEQSSSQTTAVRIYRPRSSPSSTAFPPFYDRTSYTILTDAGPDLTADPTGLLRALQAWLASQPDDIRNKSALTTVRTLRDANATLGTSGEITFVTSRFNLTAAAHNAATFIALGLGIVFSVRWVREAAALRRARARLAHTQCPHCALRPLRTPV